MVSLLSRVKNIPFKYLLIVLLAVLVFFLRLKTFSRPSGSDCVSFYNDRDERTLVGMVAEPPEIKGKWQRVTIKDLKIGKSEALKNFQSLALNNIRGSILVKTRLYPKFHYGDILELSGELKTPPVFEDFSYKEYLEIEGIYSLMDFPKIQRSEVRDRESEGLEKLEILFFSKVYLLREKLEQIINQTLPEPHASLLAGILFGIERPFNKEFYAMMQKAGVLHIIVASGYNIVIVSSFFLGLAPVFGRKKNLIFAAFGILVYAVIAGLNPPIVRAAIVGFGMLLAEAFGRRKDALLWLAIAAFLMLCWNPLFYKSVSFQLSFAAALGLLLFGSWLQKFFWRVPAIFRESLSTTMAVQILTLPIIYFNFQGTSLISLPVNTLVLETIPIVMGLGAVATFGGLFNVSLGRVLAFPVWILLSYFIKVTEIFT